MDSFAEERFRFQARVARGFGCFFVSRAWDGSFDDYEADFSIYYAAYVVVVTVAMITYEAFMAIHRILSLMTTAPSFFENLYSLLHLTVATEVLVNFLVLNFNTPTIVEALRAVKRLETSMNFRLQDDEYFWMKRGFRVALFTMTVLAAALCRGFAIAEGTRNLQGTVAFFLTALSVVFTVCYGVIGALVLLHEKYFCVVLSRFVEFQAESTKKVLCSPHSSEGAKDVTRAIQRLRSSFAVVTDIVRQVDKSLRFAVVVHFLCSAIAVCIVVYALFAAETSWGKLFFTVLYAIFNSVPVVDASFSAGDIRAEAIRLKAILESASPLALPSRVCRQVELFALTIDEDELCFTGSGFFTVDRPMLTSFVGGVMTYSLILVQTGRKSEVPYCGHLR
ncbi:hypothetical protein V5799_016985 [Amblyomma americanum]|uniref:Gustatory receptor n=1 Tax=Amblyomma americanum TaxID=6943 RepID=A0AAQ4F3F8_AMBAM